MQQPELRFAAGTDVGLRRTRNEDSLHVSEGARFVVLADGMGGHRGGDVASAAAVDEAVRCLAAMGERDDLDRVLAHAVRAANEAVRARARANALLAGMGTTLLLGVWRGWACHLAHVGDSRAYLWRRGVLQQLTTDHTLYEDCRQGRVPDCGGLPEAVARSVLSQAIGAEEDARPDLCACAVLPGDLFLLCSDGLSDMLGDAGMARVLAGCEPLPPEDCVARLIAAAKAAGGADNISVVVVRARGPVAARRA